MQATDLKFPGGYTHAKTIRREVAHTISQLEDAENYGTPDPAFAAFLADAAAKTPGYAGPVLPATQVVVADAQTVNVENSAGNLDSAGVATVTAGVLTGVKLAATKTILTQGDAVTIRDSSGAPSLAGTANVAAGVVTNVNITASTAAITQHADVVPIKDVDGTALATSPTIEVVAGQVVAVRLSPTSATALVANTLKKPVGTVTGTGTFGTFTVVNGVITGIVLSAS